MPQKTRNSRAAPARPQRGILSSIQAATDTASDAIGHGLNAVLPNWADDIEGFGHGIKAVLKGKPYLPAFHEGQADFNRRDAAFTKAHPVLSGAATVAGTGLGLALPAGKVAKVATRGGRMVQGAKVGAAYGALAGAGAGEGTRDRMTKAAQGVPLGAVIGAAAPVVIEGALKAAPKVSQVIREAVADESGSVPRQTAKPLPATPPKLQARHYSFDPKLEETDPSYWGSNRTPGFTPREELAGKGRAPDRTYFGLHGEGIERPYNRESGVGPYGYQAALDPDRLFHFGKDDQSWLTEQIQALPQDRGRYIYNGKPHTGPQITERLIKDAGYAGYRHQNGQIGDVAVVFDKTPVTRVEQPLPGSPATADPYDPLMTSAKAHVEGQGREYTPPTEYTPLDVDAAQARAKAFQDMPHDPSDPDVHEAYKALTDETAQQYHELVKRGFKFGFDDPANPAYQSPWDASRDIRDNKSLKVYPTDHGYGEGGITDDMVAENPMLQHAEGVTWDGKPVRNNDLFRAVHDVYGHAKENYGFRAEGEDMAAKQHLAMFSDPAKRALATETRGQNSYLNFGPNGEFNRTAGQAETEYAPQKIGLMEDEHALGGTEDFLGNPRDTAYGSREQVAGRGGARVRSDEGLRALLAQEGVEMPKAPPPSMLSPSPAPGGVKADDVFAAAQGKKVPFTEWRRQNDSGPGDLFDYSRMDQVPDVPQVPMDRVKPPRGASQRIQDALADPRVADGINGYVKRGAELGGKDWYNTEPLLQHFHEVLGPDEAPKAFGRFMDAVAATSPRSAVPDNIRTASYYHYQRENGLPVTGKPAPGYGSIAQTLHSGNMDKIVNGNGWDIYANPKPASFSTNLQGNYANATIDTHNFRLPGILAEDPRFLNTSVKAGTLGNRQVTADALSSRYPSLPDKAIDEAVKNVPTDGADLATYRPQQWVKDGHITAADAAKDPVLWATKPQPNEYGYYEDWQRDQAAKLGMAPAQYQSSMWVGAGDATGLQSPPEPFLRTLEARVKYTADRLGLDPKTVLHSFIKGEAPLLSAGAVPTAAIGALHSSKHDQTQH